MKVGVFGFVEVSKDIDLTFSLAMGKKKGRDIHCVDESLWRQQGTHGWCDS